MKISKRERRISIIALSFALLIAIIAGFYFNSYLAEYKKITQYRYEISVFSEKTGVERELIAAIICVESSFITSAKSEKGAVGLMQLMPETAKYVCETYNLSYDESALTDAAYNINLGSHYLKYLLDKFKSEDLTIISFNAGEGNLSRWLKDGTISKNKIRAKDVPFPETRSYYKKVLKKLRFYRKISPLLFDKSR